MNGYDRDRHHWLRQLEPVPSVPGAADVGYGYDDVGRLRTVTSLLGGVEKVFALDYDAKGRRVSRSVDFSLSGGNAECLLTIYVYDAAHRLASLLTQSPAGLG